LLASLRCLIQAWRGAYGRAVADDEIDISDLADAPSGGTEVLLPAPGRSPVLARFHLVVTEGPAAGQRATNRGETLSVGSHPSNDLVLDDDSVSRFHCEIEVSHKGAWLKDLASSNGTWLDGVPIREAGLREGSTLRIGRSALQYHLASEQDPLPMSERSDFGTLVGVSVLMRSMFALLERAGATQATVLIEGETGTGKEGVAESIHRASARREHPLLVVDCGAMPAALLESELFGHERGAFTGAIAQRVGVFEAANGGTVFLDEIGELPLELQPRLLRVLQQREIRRVGSNVYQSIDVRILAATNRDLRARVNDLSFRSDLYYRLAVLRVAVPPLRERPEDIPALVGRFLDELGADPEARQQLMAPDFLGRLQRAAWPGNVRELRNYVERCVVMQQAMPIHDDGSASTGMVVDPSVSYSEAKRRVLDEFERRYLEGLLSRHQGNVSRAARAAGMDRVYVYKLMHRHGLKRG